jgi:DNA (cytosine-5)-methyltransferase 1
MGLRSYYNEIDPFAAAWLRNLVKEKLIPDGDVDERSIADVQPVDLKDYTQCHFFAGVGGWSRALQLAGWPDDEPVWTGSCPCQPFSVAGKGKGTDDERHLWPEFRRLIAECRPAIVFGEQVASRAGREWLTGVFFDLESVGYAGAGADLCAAGVGAPHIRQRLYWVALADADSPERRTVSEGRRHDDDRSDAGRKKATGRHQFYRAGDMADADSELRDGRGNIGARGRHEHSDGGCSRDVADADDAGREGRQLLPERAYELSPWSRGVEWRRGADGKERRVKSGVRLLVDGVPNRVGRLRGYGNAIVPQVAATFIRACV